MDWRNKPKEFWKQRLNEAQYKITREGGTERAFTGEYNANKAPGEYECFCCGTKLFDSEAKYDSGSGWPSFFQAAKDAGDIIEFKTDNSLFDTRTEILCKTCGAHLGHVFPDGPKPTGQRFCVNSASLKFKGKGKDE
jgi:peptide-methionine (R)-S-oxide reductase